MSGMSSLGIAVSGMQAAQAGLYVTGHNIANVSTAGYSRQQTIQADFMFNTIAYNAGGAMQLGLGTDVQCIRQLRDRFMDKSYRANNSNEAFYQVKYGVGLEIESILNELEGQYKFQSILADLYNSIQELSKDPAAMDTRANFVASCVAFLEKANDTYNTLFDYQRTLNDQVKEDVKEINRLAALINEYNGRISVAEAAGDHANDFRDMRNQCLDELSTIIDITYREQPNGTMDVIAEGNELVVNGVVSKVGLRYTSTTCDFVEPVFTTSVDILDYDPTGKNNARPLFDLTKTVTSSRGNDNGELKALLVARGTTPADYTWGLATTDAQFANSPMDTTGSQWVYSNTFNKNAVIPQAQIYLDTLVHSVVQFINDTFAGKNQSTNDWPFSPYDNNDAGIEIFSRKPPIYQQSGIKYGDVGAGYIEEDVTDSYSLYKIGNIVLNPEVLNPGGYYKIATALTDSADDKGMSDNKIILDLLKMWDNGEWSHYDDNTGTWVTRYLSTDGGQPLSVNNYYRHIITEMAEETNEAKRVAEDQETMLEQISYFRDAMMGVSMDEELTNMMKYQHAYNASARMLNVIDSMLDRLINGTGRVGL